jgi:osmotically-inducible protein OsmY
MDAIRERRLMLRFHISGVVSLTGEVKDIMTSANASWTTRQVPGVKSVKNDLTVKEKA